MPISDLIKLKQKYKSLLRFGVLGFWGFGVLGPRTVRPRQKRSNVVGAHFVNEAR